MINIDFDKHHLNIPVMVIDIIDSTKKTISLPPEKIDLFYSIFFEFMYRKLDDKQVKIIKNTGDGLLMCFPNYSQIEKVKIDKILDIVNIMLDSIPDLNNDLTRNNLPSVSLRISGSLGPISTSVNENDEIVDIFGSTVNTCAKMNNMAKENTFIVGKSLHDVLESAGHSFESIGQFCVNKDFCFEVFEYIR